MDKRASTDRFNFSFFQGTKQLYYSLFVLFFRIGAGQWPTRMNADAYKGVTGVTILEIFLAISVSSWVEIVSRRQFIGRWQIVVTVLILFATNYYFLIFRRDAVKFEEQFDRFPRAKRIALRLAAIAITLAIGITFFVSGIALRRAIHNR